MVFIADIAVDFRLDKIPVLKLFLMVFSTVSAIQQRTKDMRTWLNRVIYCWGLGSDNPYDLAIEDINTAGVTFCFTSNQMQSIIGMQEQIATHMKLFKALFKEPENRLRHDVTSLTSNALSVELFVSNLSYGRERSLQLCFDFY
uniref:Uncharacterized protein n=1 Tax=Glossina pallidipes TaxID=7398 RepID=A0A1A9ZJ82_GLOPL